MGLYGGEMDINQLIKNRKKATYKAIVFRNILIFTAVLLFMFGAYTFYTYEELPVYFK